MNNIHNFVNYLKFYLPKFSFLEENACDTKAKKIGMIAGNSIHNLVNKFDRMVKKAVPVLGKMTTITLINLEMVRKASQVRYKKISDFALNTFENLQKTPQVQAINKKIKSYHLDEKFTKVRNAFNTVFSKTKALANWTVVPLYTQVLFPLGNSALNTINKHKGPVFRASKRTITEFSTRVNEELLTPFIRSSIKLTGNAANAILVKADPVLKPLKARVINPVMNNVVLPAYHLTSDVVAGIATGYGSY